MGYLVWQLICFLFAFLGNSIVAFVALQPFHHIGQSARVVPLHLLLLLLEWLESLRTLLIRASLTVHRPPPPTSRLLLLPPEVREIIWTKLLEDIVDFDDIKYVLIRDLGPRLYRYSDRLRLYMDFNPEYSIKWILQDENFRSRLQWPTAFKQSCRQLYLETSHDLCDKAHLCCSKKFLFHESRALVSWTRALTQLEKNLVEDLAMIMSNGEFNDPRITPAVHQLRGLRTLQLWFHTKEKDASMYTSDVQAYIVFQLVRSVRVSEELMVIIMEEEGPIDFDWKRVRWPATAQLQFARAVWARIRHPLSRVQYRVPVQSGQGKFVLRVKKYLE